MTVWLGAGVADKVALAVEADDEHGTSVDVATRLAGGGNGRGIVFRGDVADAFAEAASAEFFCAAEVIDGVVGTEGSQAELHGAEMLVTEREKVSTHERGE